MVLQSRELFFACYLQAVQTSQLYLLHIGPRIYRYLKSIEVGGLNTFEDLGHNGFQVRQSTCFTKRGKYGGIIPMEKRGTEKGDLPKAIQAK